MPSAAVVSLIQIKQAIAQGDSRKTLAALCGRAIREQENLERTGERTPANVLEVQR
jgi:hypothetical protein